MIETACLVCLFRSHAQISFTLDRETGRYDRVVI